MFQTSRGRKNRRFIGPIGPICFILFVALFWRVFAVWTVPSDLRIWFFDVGQGDATLIVTPHGKQVLIDGGPGKRVLSKIGEVSFPWDRDLDAVVLTHPDLDHLTGIVSVLERYRVRTVFESITYSDTAMVRAFDELVESRHIPRVFWSAGDEWEIDGVKFFVVSPARNVSTEDDNRRSIVLKVVFGDTSVLLPGDATMDEEELYESLAGDIDVLRAAHHGSRFSTSDGLLAVAKPEIAIISVGEENRFGHPHPRVLERLARFAADIFRTDKDGDILLTSSGNEPNVRPFPLPF